MDDVTVNSNVEDLELYSDNYPFRLSLRIRNFENESSYKKFVHNCEMMIRRSVEYKLWRSYIVDVLQINECMITHECMDDVTIEVQYIGAPRYLISVKAPDYKIAEDQMKKAVERATTYIEKNDGSLEFQRDVGD